MNQLTKMLALLAERHQDIWKRVDRERAMRPYDWPDFCFLPGVYAYRILNPHPRTKLSMQEMYEMVDGPRLAALASWRVTQGVYRFHPDLLEELWQTPVNDIPSEIFRRLPEWCIYIEIPKPPYCGVFVHLNYQPDERVEQIRFLFHRQGESELLGPDIIVVDLDKPTLKEGFESNNEWAQNLRRESQYQPDMTISPESYEMYPHAASLALYLCSQDAEYVHKELPTTKRTKKGTKFFPPSKPEVIEVGMRIGAALRWARDASRSEGAFDGGSTRPHVRRAHWHHYWTGQKPNQELILKWLSPILVNVDRGTIETTIHPVK